MRTHALASLRCDEKDLAEKGDRTDGVEETADENKLPRIISEGRVESLDRVLSKFLRVYGVEINVSLRCCLVCGV